ncbi:MAG TPA: TrmH family RNA methyltransferase, partial [Microthrixaceae bacterium]|nr:TrmH family RNA methyltransferase [Microthrixaceae bacterium]
PQNTGNIARLCAATQAELHLVGRLGFRIDEKAVKRAGLDYWHLVSLHVHPDLRTFELKNPSSKLLLFSANGPTSYTDMDVAPGDAQGITPGAGGDVRGVDRPLGERDVPTGERHAPQGHDQVLGECADRHGRARGGTVVLGGGEGVDRRGGDADRGAEACERLHRGAVGCGGRAGGGGRVGSRGHGGVSWWSGRSGRPVQEQHPRVKWPGCGHFR